MNCPRCDAETRPGDRFCAQCGSSLTLATPEAKAPLRGYVPHQLAEKILAAKGRVEGERRQVTILFADVSGSTAMAEDMDPEDVAAVMDGALEGLIEPVYRYEGTLARLMGDAVLAFFGAPVAHEDDAERAVRAALDMQAAAAAYARQLKEERGLDFAVRVGINTGTVVAGEIGSDLRVEYTAIGDAVNLAQRVENAAQPGTVLISADTHHLVQPLFDVRPLGPIQVRGRGEPVRVYQVLRPRSGRVSVRGLEGLDSPLVGRDEERAALQACLERLLAGKGSVVFIVGEAGIGKSRLVAEVRRQAGVGAQGLASPQWFEGRCLSYRQSLSYGPFLEIVRDWAGIAPGDTEAQSLARLRQRLDGLAGQEAVDLLPYLASLLRLPLPEELAGRVRHLDGEMLRRRLYMALLDLLQFLARQRPLVVVLEDLHWADDVSLDLLCHLIPIVAAVPLLLCLMHRPLADDAHRRPWQVAQERVPERCTRIRLRRLSDQDSRQLVSNLLDVRELPPPVVKTILTKAEGNPFFVEEIIRSLIDNGAVVRDDGGWRATPLVECITVPDTLQGVIMARLDRLHDETRRLLQKAAVIGRIFSYPVLACVLRRAAAPEVHAPSEDLLREHLLTLQAAGLIRRRSEEEYIFKHALTQEVAYRSLLRARRRELHGLVGDCLEQHLAGSLPEHYSLLAQHYSLSERREKALRYLLLAGDQARRTYANEEAQISYSKALELLEDQSDPRAATAWMSLGEVHELQGHYQEAMDCYRAARDLWQSLDQPALAADACYRLGQVHARLNQLDEARQHFRQGLAWVEPAGVARKQMAWGYLGLAAAALRQSPTDAEGQRHLARAIQLSREVDDHEGLVMSYGVLAHARFQSGDLAEATELAQRTLAMALQANRLEWAAGWHNNAAYWLLLQGRPAEAMNQAREGLALAEKTGHVVTQGYLYTTLADIHLYQGDWQAAREVVGQALNQAERTGRRDLEASCYTDYGEAAAGEGDLDQALTWFQRALSLAQSHAHTLVTRCRHYLAETHLQRGDLGAAQEHVRQGLEQARALRQQRQIGRLLRDEARIHTARQEWDAAWRGFEESLSILKQLGDEVETTRTLCAFGAAHVMRGQSGDREAGRSLMRQALDKFQEMGAQADERSARLLLEEQA